MVQSVVQMVQTHLVRNKIYLLIWTSVFCGVLGSTSTFSNSLLGVGVTYDVNSESSVVYCVVVVPGSGSQIQHRASIPNCAACAV